MIWTLVVFLSLVAINNRSFWGFLTSRTTVVDAAWILPNDFLPVLFTILLITCLWGAGSYVLRFLKVADEGPLERAIAIAIGAGLLQIFLMVLGLFGAFEKDGLIGVLGLFVIPTVIQGIRVRHLPRFRLRFGTEWTHRAKAVGLGLLLYAGWHTFATALAPPTEWDSLMYHLPIPKLYLEAGRLFEIPWIYQSHWPHLADLLYVLPLKLSVDSGAALLHGAFCFVLLGALFDFARREFGIFSAWIAVLLLAAHPLFLRFAGTAHSDGAWALFTFLALVSVWRWTEQRHVRWLFIGAFLTGCAASTKLLALLWVAPLIGWIAWRSKPRHQWIDLLEFCGVTAAVAGPWFLKTWLWTGNPVWPFASSIFPSRFGGALVEAAARATFQWAGFPPTEWWTSYGTLASALPVVLSLALLLTRPWKWPRFLRFYAAMSVLHMACLFHHRDFWRLIWPALPMLALFGGTSIAFLWEQKRFGRVLVSGLLVLSILPLARQSQALALFPVFGVKSAEKEDWSPREAYLRRALNIFEAFREINATLTPNDRIFLFQESRGYYLDIPYIWSDPAGQGIVDYASFSDSDAFANALRDLGITHVVVATENYVYPAPIQRLMASLLERSTRPVLSQGGITLYEWRGRPGRS